MSAAQNIQIRSEEEWGSDVQRSRERAMLRLDVLLSLDSNAERKELRASGVSEHAIESLYPVSFDDLVPGILAIITPDSLRHLDGTENWKSIRSNVSFLSRGFSSPNSYDEMEDEYMRFKQKTSLWDELYDHILLRLSGTNREERASIMVSGLWGTFWYVQRSLRYPELGTEANFNHFTEVCDWVLPNLLSTVVES